MIFAELDVPDDVLADDDGVVDENADGEREPEQAHRVQREAEQPERDERREHRDRQREPRDDRRAPRDEEQEDDEHGEDRALEQRLLDVPHRVLDAQAGVADDSMRVPPAASAAASSSRAFTPFATNAVLYPFDFAMSMPIAGATIVQRRRPRLGVSGLDVRHLTECDRAAVALRDDESEEILRVLESTLETDGLFGRSAC